MKRLMGLILFAAAAATVGAESHVPAPVCHKGRIIIVDSRAVPAHLAHGDPAVELCSAGFGDS